MMTLLNAYLTWRTLALYLVLGWSTYGVMLWFRDVPQDPAEHRRILLACLTFWPLGWLVQVATLLHWLAVKVFDPDYGPIAAVWLMLKRIAQSRHHVAQREEET